MFNEPNSYDGGGGGSGYGFSIDGGPNVLYPGDDPTQAPEGFEWRGRGVPGSKEGNYIKPGSKEYWHPDLEHPAPIGSHWDYRDTSGGLWRVFADGRIEGKILY